MRVPPEEKEYGKDIAKTSAGRGLSLSRLTAVCRRCTRSASRYCAPTPLPTFPGEYLPDTFPETADPCAALDRWSHHRRSRPAPLAALILPRRFARVPWQDREGKNGGCAPPAHNDGSHGRAPFFHPRTNLLPGPTPPEGNRGHNRPP